MTIVERVNRELGKILADPEIVNRLAELGFFTTRANHRMRCAHSSPRNTTCGASSRAT